jgi:hypothetical protein
MTIYKFCVGAVLTFAMITVLTLAALSFSARDFQYGVLQVSEETGGLVDFAALERAKSEIADIERDLNGVRQEVRDLGEQIEVLDVDARRASDGAEAARLALVGALASVEQSSGGNANIAGDSGTEALSQRLAAYLRRSGLAPGAQEQLVAAQSHLQTLVSGEERLAELDESRIALMARQRLLQGQVAEADSRQNAWRGAVIQETREFDRISAEADALRNMSPAGVSLALAQGHPALLSTIVVLLMGSLGSLLYLFPAYLNRAIPVTIAEIIVRIIFGMCAALAFYVLANAAVAGFSIGGAANADAAVTAAALNPFTVSLIGIVAGVLSEDIAKWIAERGRGILTQGGVGAVASPPPPAPEPERAAGGGAVNDYALR